MTRYRIGNRTFQIDDAEAAGLLADAHRNHARPVCLCSAKGVPMYIALVNQRYILKRMPGTGSAHRPQCESYEPPAELSGFGEVAGAAIQENLEDGTVALRLDFALTKAGGRAAPVLTGVEHNTVGTAGRKLTLRGTLHYLWQQARFNRWSPRMAGKRNWSVVRKYLLHAAGSMSAKGSALEDSLFIPESFTAADSESIAKRRGVKLAPLATTTKGSRKLALLVAEFKQFDRDHIIFKHLPGMRFRINSDMRKGIDKHFAGELQMRDYVDDSHLIVAATFGFVQQGIPDIEAITMMNVDANWLPFEDTYDLQLVKQLVDDERSFTKSLRFNLARKRPLAAAVLHDTQPEAVALYVIPPSADDAFTEALAALAGESRHPSWFWQATPAGVVPALPAIEGYVSMPAPASDAQMAQAAAPIAQGASDDESLPSPADD